MAYLLNYNNMPLYVAGTNYTVRSPSVHLAVGEPGSLSFTVDYNHPTVSELRKMAGTVELSQDGTVIYRGRIVSDSRDFNNSRKVETEGVLASLNDSIIPPFNFPDDFQGDPDYQTAAASGNVVEYLFNWILSQHNSAVENDRKILPGTVSVTDANNYIARSSTDYSTSWETIKSKLSESSIGGYLAVRYEADGTYLDYLSDFTMSNPQTVSFGENLIDQETTVNGTDIFTAILPTGKDGLTISALSDGDYNSDIVKQGALLYSRSGRLNFGRITKHVEWADVTSDTNLRRKAADLLQSNGQALTTSIEVRAIDLHLTNEQVSSFRVGRKVQMLSSPHGISQTFNLSAMDFDFTNPSGASITLGTVLNSETDYNQNVNRAIKERQQETEIELGETQQSISELQTSVTEQITQAVQTSQAIILSALENYTKTNDFTTYQNTVSSQLAILADGITVSISQLTDKIDNVGGDLQRQVTDITKMIRFTSDGIIIGETGNELVLRLDNDIIEFLQNNVRGLWMNNTGLHAESIKSERLQVGNVEILNSNGKFTMRKAVL